MDLAERRIARRRRPAVRGHAAAMMAELECRRTGAHDLGALRAWLIDPQSGQIGFWTQDGGIDGRTPVDLDELDLIPIQPLPSWVWYRDMADFA